MDARHDAARGFAENVTSTYVVYDAAFAMGVRHFVYASSVNAYGVCHFPDDEPQETMTPLYFPVDEGHPLIPRDDYPLGKRVGEEIAAAFAGAQRGRDGLFAAFSQDRRE